MANVALPAISFTSPTPPRPVTSTDTTTPTPRSSLPSSSMSLPSTSPLPPPPTYRLLYRGALSLPDSHLLLDGLTFSARLASPSKHTHLLDNPLALALESMRGRPSLSFLGTVKLGAEGVWMDESGGVEMDIHPQAILSRVYFETMFCLMPFPQALTSAKGRNAPQGGEMRSEVGIKVALGDSDGPDTTQIIIFARAPPNTKTLQLTVARLTSVPPAPPTRLPRPDDPTPRKPPATFGRRDLKRVGSMGAPKELKRVASGSVPLGEVGVKRQKLSGAGSLADLGSGVRLGGVGGEGVFKIPDLPAKAGKRKGKEKERAEDVFGNVADVVQSSKAKGKKKTSEESQDVPANAGESEVEKANKNMIKKAAMNYLARTKDPTSLRVIDKTHPEFKEIWGYVYRGVGFALRAQMRTVLVDASAVQRLVSVHVGMYVGTGGGDTGVDSADRRMLTNES